MHGWVQGLSVRGGRSFDEYSVYRVVQKKCPLFKNSRLSAARQSDLPISARLKPISAEIFCRISIRIFCQNQIHCVPDIWSTFVPSKIDHIAETTKYQKTI